MIFGDKIHQNVLVSCDHGLMIVNRFDCNNERVGQGQWLLDHGNASTPEAYVTLQKLPNKPDLVIFDIGANIGTYLTIVGRAVPNAKIYCFEPQRQVFQILCGNIAINNLYNCYTYNIAFGAENKRLIIDEPDYQEYFNYGSYSLLEKRAPKLSTRKDIVTVRTLDSFVEENEITSIDFLKIDVEGMELDVLRGAKNTLEKINPIIFIEHSQYAGGTNSIADILQKHLGDKYNYEIHGNNMLAIPKKMDKDRDLIKS